MLIGYARSSKAIQDTTAQVEALKQAGCERIFEEKASGQRDDRPILREALTFARPGDEIVVWRLDRLARSMRHLLATADDLKHRNVGLRSLTEQINSTSATGELVFHLFAALGQFEVQLLKERLAHSMAARGPGQRGGRPKVMTEPKIAMAKALLMEGKLPVHEVAREVGVGVSTLYRALPQAKSWSDAASVQRIKRSPTAPDHPTEALAV
jgi:DNA invertase Pin-like site-specific DNA recombinase